MSAEPARDNVVPLPKREYVADPVTGEVLSPAEAQQLINSQAEQLKAITQAHADQYRRAENAQKKLEQKKKDDEEAMHQRKDAGTVTTCLEWHYKVTGEPDTPVVLTSHDADLCRWLLGPGKMDPKDVCYASVGLAGTTYFAEKGLLSFNYLCTTKDTKGRHRDHRKARRFAEFGKKLRGEA